MRIRQTKIRSAICAILFTTNVNIAEATTSEQDAARREAKAELIASLSQINQPLDLTSAGHAPGRIVPAQRLEAAFELLAAEPTGEPARLPRSRPSVADADEALAYAETTARPKKSRRGGQAAIEEMVRKHALDHALPPALAEALVQVESGFNPKATGRNGEIGLLQIKPQTARAMGYDGSARSLYDPETNLAVGMKYLAKAHERSGGDTCGTLLRYNAGLDAKRHSRGSKKFCAKVKSVMAKRA